MGRGEYRLSLFVWAGDKTIHRLHRKTICEICGWIGKTIGHDVFGRSTFEKRPAVVFEPCVAGDFAIDLIAHAEDDARAYSAMRKITMKHSRALPANRREDQEVDREK